MSAGGEDREAELLAVETDQTSGVPVMVLRERGGAARALPIWIGRIEAGEIELLAAGQRPARPLTHQLLVAVLEASGQVVRRVRVCALGGGVFRAELVLGNGAHIDARPSDAVAVALAAGARIYIAAAVLDQAAVPFTHIAGGAFTTRDADDPDPSATVSGDTVPGGAGSSPAVIDEQAAAMARWLETATGADFGHHDTGAGSDDPGPDDHPGPPRRRGQD